MAAIDVEALREHMKDRCGTAMFSGFPTALLDLSEIEGMDGYELCRKAESMGVDLGRFEMGELGD